jgi:AcrR family transcriptional regulator
MASAAASRAAYHHGDLANALTDAAVDLARAGGPGAVVLREAARRVGVSATSAYRHFAGHDDLIAAVRSRAQQELAESMRTEPVVGAEVDGTDAELARLHALGRGYLRFAQTEPGLFRAAFSQSTPTSSDSYQLLTGALDDLVTSGRMAPERRPNAETAVWSTVHGLAELLLDGPLAALDDAELETVILQVQDFIVRGIG